MMPSKDYLDSFKANLRGVTTKTRPTSTSSSVYYYHHDRPATPASTSSSPHPFFSATPSPSPSPSPTPTHTPHVNKATPAIPATTLSDSHSSPKSTKTTTSNSNSNSAFTPPASRSNRRSSILSFSSKLVEGIRSIPTRLSLRPTATPPMTPTLFHSGSGSSRDAPPSSVLGTTRHCDQHHHPFPSATPATPNSGRNSPVWWWRSETPAKPNQDGMSTPTSSFIIGSSEDESPICPPRPRSRFGLGFTFPHNKPPNQLRHSIQTTELGHQRSSDLIDPFSPNPDCKSFLDFGSDYALEPPHAFYTHYDWSPPFPLPSPASFRSRSQSGSGSGSGYYGSVSAASRTGSPHSSFSSLSPPSPSPKSRSASTKSRYGDSPKPKTRAKVKSSPSLLGGGGPDMVHDVNHVIVDQHSASGPPSPTLTRPRPRPRFRSATTSGIEGLTEMRGYASAGQHPSGHEHPYLRLKPAYSDHGPDSKLLLKRLQASAQSSESFTPALGKPTGPQSAHGGATSSSGHLTSFLAISQDDLVRPALAGTTPSEGTGLTLASKSKSKSAKSKPKPHAIYTGHRLMSSPLAMSSSHSLLGATLTRPEQEHFSATSAAPSDHSPSSNSNSKPKPKSTSRTGTLNVGSKSKSKPNRPLPPLPPPPPFPPPSRPTSPSPIQSPSPILLSGASTSAKATSAGPSASAPTLQRLSTIKANAAAFPVPPTSPSPPISPVTAVAFQRQRVSGATRPRRPLYDYIRGPSNGSHADVHLGLLHGFAQPTNHALATPIQSLATTRNRSASAPSLSVSFTAVPGPTSGAAPNTLATGTTQRTSVLCSAAAVALPKYPYSAEDYGEDDAYGGVMLGDLESDWRAIHMWLLNEGESTV
ncbi:hypothetical protein BDN72DRAFT_217360 [Pluteus cervinus]|uniref:Uncharacterized protein n=1 Tax=Pluteus cervinus TaxID=181527 RepID=A0ACD3B679_9AGAR|nr:hypothetical protein BDN72DRAFT_217360 [Pluteus cervinus]